MGQITWRLNEITTSIGGSLETLESDIIKIKEELNSLHMFLDAMNIPRQGQREYGWGELNIGQRMMEFKNRDIRFESLSSKSSI